MAELQRSMRQLQRACADAATTAAAALGTQQPEAAAENDAAAALPSLVDALADRLRDKETAVRRLVEAAAAAADAQAAEQRSSGGAAAAQLPLEASQRVVIRDLSARVAALTRQAACAASERDQAAERLATLRASLGSARGSNETTAHADDKPLAATAVPSAAAPALLAAAGKIVPAAAPAEADALDGLCCMLGHHLDALESTQLPLQDALLQLADWPDASSPEGVESHCLSHPSRCQCRTYVVPTAG